MTAQEPNPIQARSAVGDLVDFAISVELEDIPDHVLAHARLALLDFLSLTVSGSAAKATEIARLVALDQGGNPQATIPGSGERTGVVNAALVGGLAAHVDDFDDTHEPTILHPTSPVFGAALPIAEWRQASGRDLLVAYVAGVEVACRVALALGGPHYLRGWHVTGTAGVVGAAAASGKLLGLGRAELTNAFGVAATGASGHREQFGYMTKSFHAGSAAAGGALSALLAARGFDAAPTSFDGRRGMIAVMSDGPDMSALNGGLGDNWELDRVGFKPYACGVVTHPAIDAVIQLREESGLRLQDIESLKLRVHPLVGELTGKVLPATGLEGKFSVGFVCALALSEGMVIPSLFRDERASAPAIVDLQRRIDFVVDDGIGQDQAVASASLRDGSVVEVHIDAALGSLGRPMSQADVEAKSSNLLEPILGPARAAHLRDLCRHPERLRSVDLLVGATSPEA